MSGVLDMRAPPVENCTTARMDIPLAPPFQKSIVFGRIQANFTKSELLDYFFRFGNILDVSV